MSTRWTGSVCGWGAVVSSVLGVAGVDLWAVEVTGAVSEFVETDCRRSSSFEALVALALGEITGIAIGTAGGVVGNAGVGLLGTAAECEEGTTEEGVVGWVESISDGGLVVGGVPVSETDAAVEGSLDCLDTEESSDGLAGGGGGFFRRRSRPGKDSPGAEYHGNCTTLVKSPHKQRYDARTGGLKYVRGTCSACCKG